MLLFNIYMLDWDDDLLVLFDILCVMLLQVCDFSVVYVYIWLQFFFDYLILIVGIVGDQQVVLFGQVCFQLGMVKNIYGIGCFMLMYIGVQVVWLCNGLLIIIVWGLDGCVEYVLEGLIFIVGLVVQWLCDGLCMIECVSDSQVLVVQVFDSGGVYLVLVFVGLGVFYWCSDVCGVMFGLICGMCKVYFVCVVLEVMVYQICDVFDVMQFDVGIVLIELCVDGGVIGNDFLVSFQVDIFGVLLLWSWLIEIIVFGVVYLVGLVVGFWFSCEQIVVQWGLDWCFELQMEVLWCEKLYVGWQQVVVVIFVFYVD